MLAADIAVEDQKANGHQIRKIKVSVIINTYNRYKSLLRSIESVVGQTHKNIEIIVVDDRSTDRKYLKHKHTANIKWIVLDRSSREVCGFPCLGYTRNAGISHATGDYIAFLDDDDIWMPQKISVQLNEMMRHGVQMSCTEGFMGDSYFKPQRAYPLYYKTYYEKFCRNFFLKNYGSWSGGLPRIFTSALISKHNFIIHSSVTIERAVLSRSGYYNHLPLGAEDADMWLRILKYTNCIYIDEPLIYYDGRLSQHTFTNRLKRKIRKILNGRGLLN
ncbi:glycosyltransferase family 2 protein [Mucilaginibacter sp. AK015]|uniref:glycosyltransferase family 2 protein n=1 Tax=Mucilaginibacter sp. AK015 TaxID=2723072 RepID=UPI00160E781B|nr:glycosyltransferase family 2 protein [Mucilaginibacter sp. AK015]MBB5394631.1 glycosyltransferase involved in cell wall biosynthesis [Mucilaginibacter sp. AK015]